MTYKSPVNRDQKGTLPGIIHGSSVYLPTLRILGSWIQICNFHQNFAPYTPQTPIQGKTHKVLIFFKHLENFNVDANFQVKSYISWTNK